LRAHELTEAAAESIPDTGRTARRH
jgi:hypothetical protein